MQKNRTIKMAVGTFKRLDRTIKRGGFTYLLDRRNEYACIYEKYLKDKLIAYEVFRVMVADKRLIGSRTVPAHEKFPWDESFGIWAWSFMKNSYAEALIKFGEISGKQKERKHGKH